VDLHNKFREDRSSGSRDMLAVNRHTRRQNTDRQTDRNTPLPYRGRITVNLYSAYFVTDLNRAECASRRRTGKSSDGV